MSGLQLYRKSRRKRRQPEASLQMTVIEYLRLLAPKNTIYFSIPNERKCSEVMGAQLKRMGLLPGVADLCIIVPGKAPCFLELKARGEEQSEDQGAFEALCDRHGAPYGLADNINDALAILRAWGALPLEGKKVAA